MTPDEIRRADETLRNFAGKAVKSACYAPFVQLYLTPTGEVLACCRNQTFILGDLREQRLAEIWNGGKISALRKALTEYKFNLGCTYCQWESHRRGDSFAIRLMSDHLPVLSPDPVWPSVIEFNGSNTCNLECIMCCGENSSSIRANLQGLPPLPKIYDDRFFEDLRSFLPHLQFINILGGEPFLSAETHRIWDMMIEEGLLVPCRVTTNGTQFNQKVERAIRAVPMHITLSLDGVTKETYESIRHRANFETVISNLHRFHAYTRERGTNFGISYCLMRQNWREVGDIALLAEELDCELSIVMVAGPSLPSLFTLPPRELREIVGQIEKIGDTVLPRLRRHRNAWEETVRHLLAATDTVQVKAIEKVMSFDLVTDAPLGEAGRLTANGDYERALQKIQSIRKGHADYYYAISLRSYIRGLQGDLEGAEKDIHEALSISRKLPDAYLNLARIHCRRRQFDSALSNALLAAERLVPEERIEAQTLALLGVICTRRWRIFQASRAFGRLSALPPATRKGVAIPDSANGTRRCLTEIGMKTETMKGRGFAFCTRSLFRLGAACYRVRERVLRPEKAHRSALRTPGESLQALIGASQEKARWSLRVAGVNNRARLIFLGDESHSLRIDIAEAATGISHDIQLNYARIEFASGCSYRMKFRVRADQPRKFGFGIAKADAPWSNLGFYRTLEANDSWQEVRGDFVPEESERNGRLHLDLGESGVSIEIACLELAPA
jgi:MoaA/NifB/PqqE/SkfB family radical SAM enzyme/tetratricopeptide (TPR) repeat protein